MKKINSLLLLASLSFQAAAQNGPPPAVVQVSDARTVSMTATTIVPGTVVSRDAATLAAEVEGLLRQVAEVGERVEAGDVLAQIDDRALKLRELELQADLTRVQARLDYAKSEEERLSRLAQQQNAAKNQLEQVRSDRRVAEGDLQVATARLEQLQDQLSRTQLKAPFPGSVVSRLATPGERVSEGMGVVRLVNQERLEVIVRAPLDYLGFLHEGDVLPVRVGLQQVEAVVRALVSVGGENAHVFEARLNLEGESFPVGQTVRVTMPASEQRSVLAVPRDALVLRPQGIAVFVLDAENAAHRVEVETGQAQGELIEVAGALQPGDRVVIRGNERLRDGQPTTVQASSTSISSR